MSVRSWLPAVLALVFSSGGSLCAELGAPLTTYRDMHLSAYGSLFFVEGATSKARIPISRKFVPVNGSGEVSLPRQSGYCFVINHYNQSLALENRLRPYRGTVVKSPGRPGHVPENIARRVFPTANENSIEVADICFNGLTDVTKVEVIFEIYNAPPQAISFNLN